MAEQYKLIHPIKHFRDFLDNKVRLDGRNFDKCRPIGINVSSFHNALGSCAIKIGNTNVICGVRAELAKPKASTPRCGYVIPNIDLSFIPPASHLNIGHDLPEILSCHIYNILNDFECIKLEDLCIQPMRLVWCLYIDIVCLEVDGGIFDAAVVACVAALTNLKLPVVSYDGKTDKIDVKNDEKKLLQVNAAPVISTYCLFDNVILTDPTHDEEIVSSALIHLGVCTSEVGVFHKRGGVPIRRQEIDTSMNNAVLRANEITNLFETLQKSNIG